MRSKSAEWPETSRSLARQRLQPLECQTLGILDARKIEPADEGGDGVAVAIGQRNLNRAQVPGKDEDMTEKWEEVCEGTSRLGVEGGWLCRVADQLAFVPTAIEASLSDIG